MQIDETITTNILVEKQTPLFTLPNITIIHKVDMQPAIITGVAILFFWLIAKLIFALLISA